MEFVKIREYILTTLITFSSLQGVNAHCQVPCGIYDDSARVKSMQEDAETVSKAVKMLTALTEDSELAAQNQRVRWVLNKELHAQRIIETISNYFLTQRVKVTQEDYEERLKKHHAVIVAAMNVKQQIDVETVKALNLAILELKGYYK